MRITIERMEHKRESKGKFFLVTVEHDEKHTTIESVETLSAATQIMHEAFIQHSPATIALQKERAERLTTAK